MGKPKYWRGLDELAQTPEFLAEAEKEFPADTKLEDALEGATEEALSVSSNRRDFLKLMGFGITAATLAACAEGPVKKAIPYVNKPHDIVPGVANWYASTTVEGIPVLVKTREGRPIKLEGNPDSPLTRGGLSAVTHGSLLGLYDSRRFRSPFIAGNNAGWDEADQQIRQKLANIQANGGKLVLLTGTLLSPATQQIIDEFLAAYEGAEHVTYDALSASALATAHEMAFGTRAIPAFHFDQAEVVVSFSADFLGTWINPAGFAADYAQLRDPDGKMSRHLQFESLMSNTGANADLRFPLNPSQQGIALLNLYNKVAGKLGRPSIPGVPKYEVAMNGLERAASDLVAAQGKGLVVCGTNDVAQQAMVAAINAMLGNYGTTLDIANPSYFRKGDDAAMAKLVGELKAGTVSGLLIHGTNPAYSSPFAAEFEAALPNLDLAVSFAGKGDETSALCSYVTPDNHYLESWNDAQQTATHYSLQQPTIHPIFNTRPFAESLLKWSGNDQKYSQYLKTFWEANMFPKQEQFADFRSFWNETLRKGVFTVAPTETDATFALGDEVVNDQADALKAASQQGGEGVMELVAYPKVAIRDGEYADNPWLQELPDPVTKVTWDNYVTVPYAYAAANGLKNGDVLKLTVGQTSMNMPVVVQPGQAQQTFGIALGYGRTKAGETAARANGKTVSGTKIAGADAYKLVSVKNGAMSYSVAGVGLQKLAIQYPLALTQTFNTLYDPAKGVLFGDDYDRTERIIEETTYPAYKSGDYKREVVGARLERKQHLVTLWDSHYDDPETARTIHWKMAIDLNKCTGCGACVVSCNAENNVPVVGKDEVMLRREMHWIRIDRYYSGSQDNPDVAFQPMLCQHCDNAPCETVCPVLATVHSNEGLNQMTYNRCVGTRYCANNCPYKVRRFNWFNYWNDNEKYGDLYSHSELGRMVLNPDVTVRFRGVMEKCSFCVQRLQEEKLRAKVNANSTLAKPKDGAVKTACQQSCPTGAIVFGDFNDPNSEVSKAYRQDRSYAVLEDVKTLPSVQYQSVVRNRTDEEAEIKAQELAEARDYDKA